MSEPRPHRKIKIFSEKYKNWQTFYANAFFLTAVQYYDLLGTKGMIQKHGIEAEANKIAQHLFLTQPEIVDFTKMIAVPLIILLLALPSYTYLHKRSQEFDGPLKYAGEAAILAYQITNVYIMCNMIWIAAANVYRG